jgi:hypothetical protein
LLELEKTSTQNHLDDVLKLATQQNNSFIKKYEEVNACDCIIFFLVSFKMEYINSSVAVQVSAENIFK